MSPIRTAADLYVASFYTTLWLGALTLAGNAAFEPFPDDLEQLAERFFTLYRAAAKA